MTFPPIVCTLGRTTDDPEVVTRMIAAGMGMARVNTAYAPLDELARRVDGAGGVPVMLDLKGPQLRVECTTEKKDPETGALTTVPARYPAARGDLVFVGFEEGPVRFNHDFEEDLEPGDIVTFQNGTLRCAVADPAEKRVEPRPHAVLLEVLDPGGGWFLPQTGANVPGKRLNVPRLSARDHQAIDLGIAKRVAWYALSFAREPEDAAHLARALADKGDRDAGIVLKIEEPEGIANLERTVAAVRETNRPCAVMIARGDLFVELPWHQLPAVQADLLRRTRALDVPSIVATGLLLSMQEKPIPARSEVADVAAAIQGGADALLLSDETSNGKHPVLAVEALATMLRAYARC